MLASTPIQIGQRQIGDDELQQMLLSASANGDTIDFFSHFTYHGEPHQTLAYGQSLLSKCKALAPDVYRTLHKGPPFYWLAEAAFVVNDYEPRPSTSMLRFRRI